VSFGCMDPNSNDFIWIINASSGFVSGSVSYKKCFKSKTSSCNNYTLIFIMFIINFDTLFLIYKSRLLLYSKIRINIWFITSEFVSECILFINRAENSGIKVSMCFKPCYLDLLSFYGLILSRIQSSKCCLTTNPSHETQSEFRICIISISSFSVNLYTLWFLNTSTKEQNRLSHIDLSN